MTGQDEREKLAEWEVEFGFTSYADNRFELIVRDRRTGEETTLEGQLKPEQLRGVDRILPTCVFVSAASRPPAPALSEEEIARYICRNFICCASCKECGYGSAALEHARTISRLSQRGPAGVWDGHLPKLSTAEDEYLRGLHAQSIGYDPSVVVGGPPQPEWPHRDYPIEHEIKCWPLFYSQVESGKKPFELRKHDRDYQLFDTLLIREFCGEKKDYTGRQCRRTISYLLRGPCDWGLAEGYSILGLKPPTPASASPSAVKEAP